MWLQPRLISSPSIQWLHPVQRLVLLPPCHAHMSSLYLEITCASNSTKGTKGTNRAKTPTKRKKQRLDYFRRIGSKKAPTPPPETAEAATEHPGTAARPLQAKTPAHGTPADLAIERAASAATGGWELVQVAPRTKPARPRVGVACGVYSTIQW